MKNLGRFNSAVFASAALWLALAGPLNAAAESEAAQDAGIVSRTVNSVKRFFGGEDGEPGAVAANVVATSSVDLAKVTADIKAAFKVGRPDLVVGKVEVSELPGIYAVELVNGPVLYSTADGRFFIAGDLYEMGPAGIENVAERKMMPERAALLAAVDKQDMIIFSPEGETKASIYVFTDVDCGYCQKLHREVPQLNAKGIEVRYLAYPRAGLQSPTYSKMASAWCADDRQEAMNILKSRGQLAEKSCARDPIPEQYKLGMQIGVTGTPAIVTEKGRLIPGYKPADQLAAIALQ